MPRISARPGTGRPSAPNAWVMAAQIACWLSTSVPSQSNMTSFMAAAYSIAAPGLTNS